LFVTALFGATKHGQRLEDASTVLDEVMAAPDKGIPSDLLNRAHCVVIVPGLKKAAFIFGARHGKGYVTCRKGTDGGWSSPATVRVEGGSFGLQLGEAETHVIMLVMNQSDADRLMTSKFTLGIELRRQRRVRLDERPLSYSRSRGMFAGVVLRERRFARILMPITECIDSG
jgi:lipid-binding SYLF domain-containing protein